MSEKIKTELLWAACRNDDEREAVLAEAHRRVEAEMGASRQRAACFKWAAAGGVERALASLAPEVVAKETPAIVSLGKKPCPIANAVYSCFNGHPVSCLALRGMLPNLNVDQIESATKRLIGLGRLNRVKRGVFMKVSSLLIGLLLVGCASPKPVSQRQEVAPPPIPFVVNVVVNQSAAAAPPAPPKPFAIAWDNNYSNETTTTQVWTTQDFQDWTFLTETRFGALSVPANQPKLFFKIRNRDGNEFSEWATK